MHFGGPMQIHAFIQWTFTVSFRDNLPRGTPSPTQVIKSSFHMLVKGVFRVSKLRDHANQKEGHSMWLAQLEMLHW